MFSFGRTVDEVTMTNASTVLLLFALFLYRVDSQCLQGTYSATGNSPCTSCIAGKFAAAVGQTICDECVSGFYSGTGYSDCYNDASLSTKVEQRLVGCDWTEYSVSTAAAELSIKQTIAGVTNLQTANVLDFTVLGTPAYQGAHNNITVTYTLEVPRDSATVHAQVYSELTEETSNGAFDNLLSMFATANSAPVCLQTSTSDSIEMVSYVPSQAPTPNPTMTPTSLNWDHVEYLLNDNLTYTIIVSSIVGLLCLYYGGHGVLHLYRWWVEYNQKIEDEYVETVKFHDDKLFKKFVKTTNDEASPHTSQMRQNFKAIYGEAPMSRDEMTTLSAHLDDEESGNMKNMTGSAAPPGGVNQRLIAMKEREAKESSFEKNMASYSPSKGVKRSGSPGKASRGARE